MHCAFVPIHRVCKGTARREDTKKQLNSYTQTSKPKDKEVAITDAYRNMWHRKLSESL